MYVNHKQHPAGRTLDDRHGPVINIFKENARPLKEKIASFKEDTSLFKEKEKTPK